MPGDGNKVPDSVDDLFKGTMVEDYDDESAWDAIKKLRRIGTCEVLEKSIEMAHSEDPLRRARAADVLSQLGVQPGVFSTSFVPERLQALLALLQSEAHALPLASTISAIGHLDLPEGSRAILPFATHPDENVRFAVACSLPHGLGDDPDVIATLFTLMGDPDSDVRDWATFGLGTKSSADSPAIREALFARLQDSDGDTRAEAAVGLARRKDLRVLPVILEQLEQDEYGILYEEAASDLLEMDCIPKGWESWKYIEELKSRYNVAREKADLPPQ